MIRKTLTILSLIGLLLSVGLWGVSHRRPIMFTVWDSDDAWVFGEFLDGHVIATSHWLNLDHLSDSAEEYQDEELEGPPAYAAFEMRSKKQARDFSERLREAVRQVGLHFVIRFPKPFNYRRSRLGFSGLTTVTLGFPFWVVGLGLLALSIATGHEPIRAIRRHRKRQKLGLCLKCGYDLRGSKERCPECGTGIIQM